MCAGYVCVWKLLHEATKGQPLDLELPEVLHVDGGDAGGVSADGDSFGANLRGEVCGFHSHFKPLLVERPIDCLKN